MTEVAVALIWEGGKFMICQRPARMFSGLSIVGFQFSPPRGGRRTGGQDRGRRERHFNSRPRVGGVVFVLSSRQRRRIFQFSPPRGGRRDDGDDRRHGDGISILAPAWGASDPQIAERLGLSISILAPAWGASQLRHGDVTAAGISILAPAWGASGRGVHAGKIL